MSSIKYSKIKDIIELIESELRRDIRSRVVENGLSHLFSTDWFTGSDPGIDDYIYSIIADWDWYGGQLEEHEIKNWDSISTSYDHDDVYYIVNKIRSDWESHISTFIEICEEDNGD